MLYQPLGVTAVHSLVDALIAAAGFLLLVRWQVAPILVVIGCVASALMTGPH
jgi:hypothetical protein